MDRNELQQRIEVQRESQSARATSKQAEREAASAQEYRENPYLIEQLRKLGLDSEAIAWLEAELGPLAAGAHAFANRSAQQEHRIEWGLHAEGEQMNVERSPGRLCTDDLRELAAGTNDRPDASAVEPASPEEKRHIRNGVDAVKALQSLGINAEGLRALTEATVVNRTETMEEEDESIRERAAGLMS